MKFARRSFLGGAAVSAALGAIGFLPRLIGTALAAPASENPDVASQLYGETAPFSRRRLRELAEALSKQRYEERSVEVPEGVLDLNYSTYRDMRAGDVWPQPLANDKRFAFDALLAGFVYNQQIELWVVDNDVARRVVFNRDSYVFGKLAREQVPDLEIPFSGVRLHADLAGNDFISELAVFQGASYFRAIGAGETYGLSARGLAIDTGAPSGEEFPVFRAFWVERLAEGETGVTVHALLESPSTTGIYQFVVTPGEETVTDVELTLFPRREIRTVGFAPFSSMFLFGTVNRFEFDDYREAVHDSNGLSIHTGTDEWLWRPITNPARLQVSAFGDENLRGFGLVQRNRDYTDYQDAEARYELRPTAWVEPTGPWGKGSIVLFEIPTDREWNDNVVAYWQPAEPLAAGTPYDLAYRIYWNGEAHERAPGPRVASTRIGRNLLNGRRLFVIDYAMNGISPIGATAGIASSAGQTSNLVQYPTPESDVLRVSFELDPKDEDLIELRLNVDPVDGPPAERWLYRWTR